MSIYSLHFSNVSRAKGSSSCATLSYISAERVYDERLGKTFNYGRGERVVFTKTILPDYAPIEFKNAATLFNAIERAEKQSNARTAKKVMVALPRELSMDQMKKTLDEFVENNFVKNGYCATYAIHFDKDGNNPHAHILVANRKLAENGKWGSKSKKEYALDPDGERIPLIDKKTGLQKVDSRNRKQWKRVNVEVNMLDKKDFLKELRASWAKICNQYLAEDKKIDHRSFAERGIELIPTIHEGYAAREIEARGGISEICSANRRIKKANEELKKLISGVKEIKNNIHEIVKDWVRELEERSRELDEKVRGRIIKARRRAEQERTALERAREDERGTVGREQGVKEWIDGIRGKIKNFTEDVSGARQEANKRFAELRKQTKQLGEKFNEITIQETEKLEARVDRLIGVIKKNDIDFGEALNMYREGDSEALKSYENAIVNAFMNLKEANINERAERVSELEEAAEQMIVEFQNRDDDEWEL